ncbi:MAG: serine hydrolase domain-containing protein [Woeseiaceae bacterium]
MSQSIFETRIKRMSGLLCIVSSLLGVAPAMAEQPRDFDYFSVNREMISRGVQAVLTCNGLFTSGRNIEQVFEQELAYLKAPVGTAYEGAYIIDEEQKRVAIIGDDAGTAISAVFRPGIGCIVQSPPQGADDIDSLPLNALAASKVDTNNVSWPMGDRLDGAPLPDVLDQDALLAAADWTFDRENEEQVTISLLVTYRGQIVLERYARGFDENTRTRTWSTAKSIAATLIGQLVDQGKLALDAPLPVDWLPEVGNSNDDPRRAVTLRHVLNMSSGLDPADSFGREYATGSGLAYWAGASSADGARARGLVRTPGTHWDYENYDTLLAVLAMKGVLGDDYAEFPYRELLHRIGMRNTLLSTDRFGDFILSSQVYTNARDLARFGQLYLQDGVWEGERLISSDWIEFVRTPAPSTANRGNFYGGQFWLVPDDRTDVPKDAYATAGTRGQYVVIVPSHDLVIVRRGLDFGQQWFDRWDLTREVLKAFKTDE